MSKNGKISDFVGSGFKRIETKYVGSNPPRIKWGMEYQLWDDKKKIQYLEKFAASMNHAASLLQKERNELNELLLKKELQINSMKKALDDNNSMIQSEITRMNAEKQELVAAISSRNARIKELERGGIG